MPANNPPSIGLLAGETLAFPQLLLGAVQPGVPITKGRGQPVVVYPGYLAGDRLTARLRRSLSGADYKTYGWGNGPNLGARENSLTRLVPQLEQIAAATGQKATLIGWSLGGIFAREVAKLRPDLVRLVITLGSPFSGDARDNNAWRLYELLTGHRVDEPPIRIDRASKPPVRTIAVYSDNDGIVAAHSACGLPGESDRQIAIATRHIGMVSAPEAIRAVGDILAEELA